MHSISSTISQCRDKRSKETRNRANIVLNKTHKTHLKHLGSATTHRPAQTPPSKDKQGILSSTIGKYSNRAITKDIIRRDTPTPNSNLIKVDNLPMCSLPTADNPLTVRSLHMVDSNIQIIKHIPRAMLGPRDILIRKGGPTNSKGFN